jgi:hypothetical protein
VSTEDRGRRAEHAIYGSIIVLAVIVAEDNTSVSVAVAIGTVLGAAIVTSLAHIYSDYIGEVIRVGRHPTRREWRTSVRNAAVGFAMAILPAGFFLLAAFDAISLDKAFDIAKWVGVGVLGAYALLANLRAGFSLRRSIAIGLLFTLLGFLLVELKVLL